MDFPFKILIGLTKVWDKMAYKSHLLYKKKKRDMPPSVQPYVGHCTPVARELLALAAVNSP